MRFLFVFVFSKATSMTGIGNLRTVDVSLFDNGRVQTRDG